METNIGLALLMLNVGFFVVYGALALMILQKSKRMERAVKDSRALLSMLNKRRR